MRLKDDSNDEDHHHLPSLFAGAGRLQGFANVTVLSQLNQLNRG
jgi:hypothetical protein